MQIVQQSGVYIDDEVISQIFKILKAERVRLRIEKEVRLEVIQAALDDKAYKALAEQIGETIKELDATYEQLGDVIDYLNDEWSEEDD